MSAAASAAGCCCAAAVGVGVDVEGSAVKNEGSNSRVFSSVRGTFSASRFYVLCGTCQRQRKEGSKALQRIIKHTCFALGSSASRFAFASRRWSLAWPLSFFVLWNTSSRFCLFFIARGSNLCEVGIEAEG